RRGPTDAVLDRDGQLVVRFAFRSRRTALEALIDAASREKGLPDLHFPGGRLGCRRLQAGRGGRHPLPGPQPQPDIPRHPRGSIGRPGAGQGSRHGGRGRLVAQTVGLAEKTPFWKEGEMLKVATTLSLSRIHGIGLIAAEFIPKGSSVQEFVAGFDLEFTFENLCRLPGPATEQMLHYAYCRKSDGIYVLRGDNARFLNHSTDPNLGLGTTTLTEVPT